MRTTPRRSGSEGRLRPQSIAARALSPLRFLERFQFLPDIVAVLLPIRRLGSEVNFGYFERAVAVQANVLRARLANQEHVRPGAGGYWHAQTAQTGAAAIALIPDDEMQHAETGQEIQQHCSGEAQVVTERLLFESRIRDGAAEACDDR